MNRYRRGILDVSIVELLKAIPAPARFWVVCTLAVCAMLFMSMQIGWIRKSLEEHKAEHVKQAEQITDGLSKIDDTLTSMDIGAIRVTAQDAKQSADRANTRLDTMAAEAR